MKHAVVFDGNDLERLFIETKAEIVKHLTDEILTRAEAAKFIRYGLSSFDKLVGKGLIKCRRIEPNGDPRFLKSELIELFKKS